MLCMMKFICLYLSGIAILQCGTATSPSSRATLQSGTATSHSGISTSRSGTVTSSSGTATSLSVTATPHRSTATSPSGTTTPLSGTATSPSGTATSHSGRTTTPTSGIAMFHSGAATSSRRHPPTPSSSSTEPLPNAPVTSPSDTTKLNSATESLTSGTAMSSRGTSVTITRLARRSRSVSNYDPAHACSPEYKLRPRQERNCFGIFLCVYGYCQIDPDNSFQCICDEGGVGTECQDKCCLPCSEHGICEKFSNGTERCHCDTNYEGRLCDVPMTFEESITESAPLTDGKTVSSSGKTSSKSGLPTSPSDIAASQNGKTTSQSDITTSQSGITTSQSGITTSQSDMTTSQSSTTMLHSGTATSHRGTDTSHSGKATSSTGTITSHSGTATSQSGINTISSGTTTSHSDKATSRSITVTPTSDITKSQSDTSISTNIPDLDLTTYVFPPNHVCSPNYTMRPLKERECHNVFLCIYGYCYTDQNGSFQCVCDDGGIKEECKEKCCLPCSEEHGICEKFSNGTERCHCDTNYEGRFCDTKVTFDDVDTDLELMPFVVIPVVLIVLILTAGLLFFWMWKNRVTIVMKIVHYFQSYEDDDEKIWDVFISYKSADIDQAFVLRVLLPKLEELGFTVCLHFREFLPGESIANNIINAINKSRRTIMILTPRYVSSEFTRLEYQVAQHEMLKRKHKIIPVLLEDISMVNDTMDPNLKMILRCVTYLEYPGPDTGDKTMERFWEKLSLAMPKKRQTDEKPKPHIGKIPDEVNIEGQGNEPAIKNEETHTVDTHV